MKYFTKINFASATIVALLISVLAVNDKQGVWLYFGGTLLQYAVLLFFIIVLTTYHIILNGAPKLRINTIDIAFLVLGIYIISCVILDKSVSIWNDKTLRYFFFIAAYFFYRSVFQNRNANSIWFLIIITGLFCSVYGIIQYANNYHNENVRLAVTGPFSNSAIYSCMIALTLPASYNYIVNQKTTKESTYTVLAYLNISLAAFILVFVTFSRAAIISSIAVLFFELNERFMFLKKKWMGIGLFLLIILLSFSATFKSNSSQGRILIWRVSAMIWKNTPITGIGMGQFAYQYNSYQADYFRANQTSEYEILASNTYHAFNEYIEIIVEGGTIFTLILIGLVLMIVSTFTNDSKEWTNTSIATILTAGTFALFSYPFSSPAIGLVTVICLAHLSRQKSIVILNYKMSRWITVSICFLLITAALTALFHIEKRYGAIKKWERAYSLISKGTPSEGLKLFDKVYSELNNNGAFLFNYGAELSDNGRYSESISILKEAAQYFNHIDLYIFLGKSYEGMGNYTMAEDSYRHASFMIPNRFIPKYLLVKLYLLQGYNSKANTLAQEILNMPIKVKSKTVSNIRMEMQKIIDGQKQTL